MNLQGSNNEVTIRVNGESLKATAGTILIEVLNQYGLNVPTLCHVAGLVPRGACRICSVKIGNRLQTACTTPVNEGMEIITDDEELKALRKQIVEMMLAEGNHICPFCEKSGQCELQDLAYQLEVTVSEYPYLFPDRDIEATHPKLIKDHNRCILCKRCIRLIKDDAGKRLFAFNKRGSKLSIEIDTALAREMSEELAKEAVACCPVGAILSRSGAFSVPIGQREHDKVTTKDAVKKDEL